MIEPIIVIAFSFGLVIYWRLKKCFSKWALLYSLAAYAGAIALKYMVQIPTIGYVDSAFGKDPIILGLYFGIQTSVFEVGGAFIVASIAVTKGHFARKDAVAYGLGLAMWENGVLLGLPLLLNYIVYYVLLSMPTLSVSQTLYSTLAKDSPTLFYGFGGALPLVGYAILERISSLLAHLAWGVLAVLSVVLRKKIYFALAFPIGFIDFLVPFSYRFGLPLFETIIFLVGLSGFLPAFYIARKSRVNLNTTESTTSTQ